jgi:DNA repair protein RadC
MEVHFTLHDLPETERPRERLASHGLSALSGQELLALVLGRGTKGQPVMVLAQSLLQRYGSLKGISQASLDDLRQVSGLGLAKAAQLQAGLEIGRRAAAELQSQSSAPKIVNPGLVAELVRQKLEFRQREHYLLVSLDARSRLISLDKVSIGTLDAALVHPRETFETAIARHAAKVIICHNHPSGDPQPSDDDLAVTKRLVMAGKVLGITVIDHVIVASQSFYSFQEHGQI